VLTEYVHRNTADVDRELRELALSRPRYDRADGRSRSWLRELLRGIALAPAKASSNGDDAVPNVTIRPASATDGRALARLAEASERRFPSGLVLVAEVDAELVAALPMDERFVLTDLVHPTGDVVQLLELRSEQLRAAQRDLAA
jgi:hypothetical protein